jgi:hypothetical protein
MIIMKIINKFKKYFLTSKSCVIDLNDCTTVPSSETIVDTYRTGQMKIKSKSPL